MTTYWDPNLKEQIVTGSGPTPGWWSSFTSKDRAELESEPVGSPLWMLYRGLARLEAERPTLEWLERYWQGDHDLPDTIDAETQERYQVLINESHVNYMRTVVEVIAERIRLQGLWLPGDNERADSETWALWEANGLNSWQQVAYQEMIAKRRCYWSVWPTEEGQPPRIELEDALQCWVELTPGSRTDRAFAVKTWVDDWTGNEMVDVVDKGRIYYFVRIDGRWMFREEDKPNTLGEVPFLPMVNRPTLRGADTGFSEIEDVISSQDRLNQTILGRMLAGHTAAFMQKWASGIEIEDDDDGKPIPPFKPGVTNLWTSESDNAKFGQFDATDLKNYISGEEQELQHIANMTRLPRHYFNPNGQAPSGDAMKSAEASLVALVHSIEGFATFTLKDMLRLARKAAGLGETPFSSELVWADPEYQTFAQLVDGNTKLVAEGIASRRYAREKVGMSPQTISRVELEIRNEQLEAEMFAPEPEVAGGADSGESEAG